MDRIAGVQLFMRVVEMGSFSKAATELGVTQPTATKAVAAMEAHLGARLLHRSTRGVTPTEVGEAYYEKCKTISREMDEASNLATLMQQHVGGRLRISSSVAFGRRVLVPIVLRYMRLHPEVQIDFALEDRYINLVEQGVDLAVRMGRLADSMLGSRYIGTNPWLIVAAKSYLDAHGVPKVAADLKQHNCLVYSSVQGDDRWQLVTPSGAEQSVLVKGTFRSNNLSAVLAAAHAGMGLAALPHYVAHELLKSGRVQTVLDDHSLASQEVHAVFPSPKLVPLKVLSFIEYLQQELKGKWWLLF